MSGTRPANRSFGAVVTAAGSSSRFGSKKKEYESLCGSTVLEKSVALFLIQKEVSRIVVTLPPDSLNDAKTLFSLPESVDAIRKGKIIFTEGGATRRKSVFEGLKALSRSENGFDVPEYVLIHDGARPFATSSLVERVICATLEKGACVPVIDSVDTIKELGPDGSIARHLERSSLGRVQTPEGFRFTEIYDAHAHADIDSFDGTDDSEIAAREGIRVFTVEGECDNIKITFRDDLRKNSAEHGDSECTMRIGQGQDSHRLVEGRPLVLGGVTIPFDRGEDAHSDGDVLIHAIVDAILGAVGEGDIGRHFPPSDPRWKNAASRVFLEKAVSLARESGWDIANIDSTIVIEKPKLAPHIDSIRRSIASILNVKPEIVSVKAKTAEGLGPVGKGESVEAYAAVLLTSTGGERTEACRVRA